MLDEGNTRVLAVVPVAGNAIMREGFLAVRPGLLGVRRGFFCSLLPMKDFVLSRGYDFCFQLSWGSALQPAIPTAMAKVKIT